MNSMKRQNARILREELPRLVGAQYDTGDPWRNNSRKNKGLEPKQKQYLVADVTGDRSKVQCCKEQYCIGTWLLQHHSSKASIFWLSVFFMVQLSHWYMTTGKTIALTIGTLQNFVDKMMPMFTLAISCLTTSNLP